jgi:hypothetical protein
MASSLISNKYVTLTTKGIVSVQIHVFARSGARLAAHIHAVHVLGGTHVLVLALRAGLILTIGILSAGTIVSKQEGLYC